MPDLNQIDVSTRRYIRDNPALVDNWSQNDPLIAYAKLNVKEQYDGGSLIQEGFTYDTLIGSSYLKGKEFNTTEKQVEQAKQFQMKQFEVGVTLSLEDVEILNKDLVICTLDKGASINMELTVEVGKGYVPAAQNRPSDAPTGALVARPRQHGYPVPRETSCQE